MHLIKDCVLADLKISPPQVHMEYAKKPSTVNYVLLHGPGRGHCPRASRSHKIQDVSHFILKLGKIY